MSAKLAILIGILVVSTSTQCRNPYREGAVTAPEADKAYDEPQELHIGVTWIILEGGVVTRAFARRGRSWGGRWRHMVDYQHFPYGGHCGPPQG